LPGSGLMPDIEQAETSTASATIPARGMARAVMPSSFCGCFNCGT